jgi:hypothetical protein
LAKNSNFLTLIGRLLKSNGDTKIAMWRKKFMKYESHVDDDDVGFLKN